MTNRVVTAGTLQSCGFATDNIAIDRRSDRLVASAAGVFRHLMIELGYLNGVGIVAAGEVKGMPESVVGFHGVLADEIMWCVAVVAGCG